MADVTCTRCAKTKPAVAALTYPGELGQEIASKVCEDCWAEWQKGEVIVINELRLNFMDPASQPTLIKHMREFLFLDGAPSGEEAAALPFDPEAGGGKPSDGHH